MTTQTTDGQLSTRASRRGGGQGPSPVADRLPVPTRQRRPMLALLALVLILGGAALAATLVLTSGKKQDYLVLAGDVAQGQTLTAKDFKLQSLAATNSSLFAPVPSADFYSRVEGKKALVPLRRGALLTEGTFGDQLTPAVGLGQMSLNVPEGRYPSGLAAGDVVKVIYTPQSQGGTNGGSAAASGKAAAQGIEPGATLVPAAYVTVVEGSSSGQNGVVVGIDIRNVDLPKSPTSGMPAAAWANASSAITVVRLDPGHETYKGDAG
jgi:hypothetical protein